MFFVQKNGKTRIMSSDFFECTEKCNNNAFLTSTKKSREKKKK